MKKFLITFFCFISLLTLTGCNQPKMSQTLQSTNDELTRIEKNIKKNKNIKTYTQNDNLDNCDENCKNNEIINLNIYEEEIKDILLDKTKATKSSIKNILKVHKKYNQSLNELSKTISKYITYYNKTEKENKKCTKRISKYNDKLKNKFEQLESAKNAYISLLNERRIYIINIINSVEEINHILSKENNKNIVEDSNINNKNIVEDNNINNKNYINKNMTKNNYIQQYKNPYRNYNQAYNKNYENYGKINEYNPNRNTDTFYPMIRNIDTYRYNPYSTIPFYATSGLSQEEIVKYTSTKEL